MTIRSWLGVAPLAVAIAFGAHFIHFGEEHAFGGAFHQGLEALLAFGLCASLSTGLGVILSWTDETGLSRHTELLARLPGGGSLWGLSATLAALATGIYVVVEALERTPLVSLWAPLMLIAALALAVAGFVHRFIAWVCAVIEHLLERGAFLARVPATIRLRSNPPLCDPHFRLAYARFSRPPPTQR